MAKGYSARRGFTGGAGMMQQQAQMQQKISHFVRSRRTTDSIFAVPGNMSTAAARTAP